MQSRVTRIKNFLKCYTKAHTCIDLQNGCFKIVYARKRDRKRERASESDKYRYLSESYLEYDRGDIPNNTFLLLKQKEQSQEFRIQ